MNRFVSLLIVSVFSPAAFAQSPKTPYPSTELQPQAMQSAAPDSATATDDSKEKVEMFSGKIAKIKGQYTLYDPATEHRFLLDDQKTAAKYDRKSVAISGSLDATTNTIHIRKVFRG